MRECLRVAVGAFLAGLLALPVGAAAQESTTKEEEHNPPSFRPSKNLTEQQRRGEYMFLQRCQICHQPKYRKSAEASELPVVYRNLEGILKDSTPAKETMVREQIRRGSMRMPGFQYTLEPNEIEDVIAYLKTR